MKKADFFKKRKVKGIMNGIIVCDLCTDFCMMQTDDPFANKQCRTTDYQFLGDEPSLELLKEMFQELFLKKVEITLVNGKIIDIER